MSKLGLFSLRKRRLRRDLTNVYKYQMGKHKNRWTSQQVPTDMARSNSKKLKWRKLHSNIQYATSTVRVLRHQNRLLREVVESSSLEMFINQISQLLKVLLALSRGIDQTTPRGILQAVQLYSFGKKIKSLLFGKKNLQIKLTSNFLTYIQ